MSKQILISEEELHEIIRTEVQRILEYADPRNKYIDKVRNYFSQLVENWCLIHYCAMTNTDINQCKNHWKQELWAILTKMGSFSIKGNNSIQSRQKAISEAEESDELLSNINNIFITAKAKFNKEGIDVNNDVIMKIGQDLINDKDKIISIISNNNLSDYEEYIDTI